MKSLEKSAYEGETVNISCKFPQEYRREAPKYFCKESGGQGCKYNLSTQWNQARVRDEKLSLHDDREEGVQQEEEGHLHMGERVACGV